MYKKYLPTLTVLVLLLGFFAFTFGCGLVEETTTTTTVPDTTAPTVEAVSPTDGATDVNRSSSVTADFSEDMDESTISWANFIVTSSGERIYGPSPVVSYESTTKTAMFTPSDLPPGQSFEARLTTDIKDSAGNALEADYVWDFSTTIAPYSWIDTYGTGEGWDIAVDGSGNMYVVGNIQENGEGKNIWVRKYDSSGNVLWTSTFNGSANQDDYGKGIGLDSSGNVYAGGIENLSDGNSSVWVRKYNTDGGTLWTKQFEMNRSVSDYEYVDLAVDSSGNAYLVGQYRGTGDHVWVRKLDTNGNTLWTNTDQTGGGGSGIAVDNSSNVYVVGMVKTGSQTNGGIWVGKYDSNGNLLWTTPSTEETGATNYAHDIAVDTDGNIYAVGSVYDGSGLKAWIRKLDSNGNIIWTKSNIYSAANQSAYGIAIDANHNIFVAGNDGNDSWIRKFDNDGGFFWLLGTRSSKIADYNRGIILNSTDIYMTGSDNGKIWIGKHALP